MLATASAAVIYEDESFLQTVDFTYGDSDMFVDLEVTIKDEKVFTANDYFAIWQVFAITDTKEVEGKTLNAILYEIDSDVG